MERAAEIVRQEEEQKAREAAAAAEVTVQQPPREEAEEALPIGAHLDILDSDLPFEQQISRLAQPLSEGANRLTNNAPEPEEEAPQTVARFSGTPLVNVGEKIVRTRRHPESMHHVVERQMRGQRDEIMGEELGSGTYGLVENPIESLRTCMEYVWQNADMRQQAMDMLMENEAFTTDVAAALRRGGINLNATAAAREQLAEIEADRISLLMQLETARRTKEIPGKAIASLSQKRRDEAERLKKRWISFRASARSFWSNPAPSARKRFPADRVYRRANELPKRGGEAAGAAFTRGGTHLYPAGTGRATARAYERQRL